MRATPSKACLLLIPLLSFTLDACRQPDAQVTRFWFEEPSLISLQVADVAVPGTSPSSAADCTPQLTDWQRVEHRLPVQPGRLTIWRSAAHLTTADPGGVEISVDGSPLPVWREGTTLENPAFFYSSGGFLQQGIYLALREGVTPADLALGCRQPPAPWLAAAERLRGGQAVDAGDLIRLERLGHDARPALGLAADIGVTFGSPDGEGAVRGRLAVGCRDPRADTRFELRIGATERGLETPPARSWQTVEFELQAGGEATISRRGADLDQCFVADPAWQTAAQIERPSMLLVIVDGLRADVADDPELMPRLHVWSAAAVRFSRARVTAPWTRPSITSMLTGLWPRQHGLTSEGSRRRLAAEVPTLVEELREHGYTTASFSANPWLGPDLGLDRGFGRLVTSQQDAGDVLALAAQWIDEQSGPWFVVVFLMDTHYPFRHRPDFDRSSGIDAEALEVGAPEVSSARRRAPDVVLNDASVAKTRALYLENVAYVDSLLGDFLDGTTRARRAPIVVVTADHGEAFGEHGDLFHGWNLYDELLRVPLILGGPSLPEDAPVDQHASLRQLPATILDLAGIDDVPLPGPSLFDADRPILPLFASTRFRGTRLDAVIWNRWKLIEDPGGDWCALYDLAADAREEHNLCGERADIRATLVERLADHRAGRAYEPALGERAGTEVDRELRSLGYID